MFGLIKFAFCVCIWSVFDFAALGFPLFFAGFGACFVGCFVLLCLVWLVCAGWFECCMCSDSVMVLITWVLCCLVCRFVVLDAWFNCFWFAGSFVVCCIWFGSCFLGLYVRLAVADLCLRCWIVCFGFLLVVFVSVVLGLRCFVGVLWSLLLWCFVVFVLLLVDLLLDYSFDVLVLFCLGFTLDGLFCLW